MNLCLETKNLWEPGSLVPNFLESCSNRKEARGEKHNGLEDKKRNKEEKS